MAEIKDRRVDVLDEPAPDDEPLGDFIARLQSAASDVPAEYRGTVAVDISHSADACCCYLRVFYLRPETPEETTARKSRRYAKAGDWLGIIGFGTQTPLRQPSDLA